MEKHKNCKCCGMTAEDVVEQFPLVVSSRESSQKVVKEIADFIEESGFCSEDCEDDFRHSGSLMEEAVGLGAPDSETVRDFVMESW